MSDLPPDPRSIHVGTAPPEPPRAEPAPAPPPPPRRRRWLWFLAALALVVAVPAGAFAVVAHRSWSAVERVDLSTELHGAAHGTNYLIVGTDSRAGVAPDTANAGAIFGDGVAGERTDTIAVLRVVDDDVSLLAIPRDLYVPLGDGRTGRINSAFTRGGPAALVATVQRELGIGIDHYLEVDLAGFLGLVDALGGVTIHVPHPAVDDRSGLVIESAGAQRLDGSQALAYVRSRRYTELIEGAWVTDPTSDLGRVVRQQRFLAAVMAELGATRNPFTLLGALRAVGANVRVDGTMSLFDATSLGWTLRGAEPTTATVPTTRFITESGADVLILTAESESVLAEFRG